MHIFLTQFIFCTRAPHFSAGLQFSNRSHHNSALRLSSNTALLLTPWFQRCCSEMLAPLLVAFGKRWSRLLGAVSDVGPIHSRLPHVNDRIAGTRILAGTGAEVSIAPASSGDGKLRARNAPFQAVNCMPINTYGKRSLLRDFGLRWRFLFLFWIADIQICDPWSGLSAILWLAGGRLSSAFNRRHPLVRVWCFPVTVSKQSHLLQVSCKEKLLYLSNTQCHLTTSFLLRRCTNESCPTRRFYKK